MIVPYNSRVRPTAGRRRGGTMRFTRIILLDPGPWDPKSRVLPLHHSALRALRIQLSAGAEGRTRTGTGVAPQQILSLPRLPIPPLRRLPASRIMERKTGFEPATPSLARRCSTTEPLPLSRLDYSVSRQGRKTAPATVQTGSRRAPEWVCDGRRVPYPTHRPGARPARAPGRLHLPRRRGRRGLRRQGGFPP